MVCQPFVEGGSTKSPRCRWIQCIARDLLLEETRRAGAPNNAARLSRLLLMFS
jgi:hypothetical protein